jgi:uncharacterized membrane protein YbhN (UPF0104 family)
VTERRRRRWRTVGWTVAAVGGLWLYLRTIGVDAVAAALGRVGPGDAAALVALGWVPILLWGGSLHLVLRRLDAGTTLPESVGLFAASSFLNNVTPFGQAGGDPVSGALVARVEAVPFERGFAAIVSVGAANAVAVVALGVVGTGALLGTAAIEDAVLVAAGAGCVAAVVLGVVAVGAWRRRDRIVERVGKALGGCLSRIGGVVPGIDPPTPDAVVTRGRGFVAALEGVGDARWRLTAVLALGVAGQLAVATTLWLSLAALGASVSPANVLVVVPVARLAGASPTPGGTASAEALLTGLLVAVGGTTVPVAAAAALVYRAAAFWLPTLGGGVVTAVLLAASGTAGAYDSRR